MNPRDFRLHIIRPILEAIDLWSENAENLLLGTALVESDLQYLKQIGGGPALGLYQMEPRTHDDIWKNYLAFRPRWEVRVRTVMLPLFSESAAPEQLMSNPAYATAMARIHYLRVKAPLPPARDAEALGRYWKQHYNTPRGKGRVEEFVRRLAPHLKAEA